MVGSVHQECMLFEVWVRVWYDKYGCVYGALSALVSQSKHMRPGNISTAKRPRTHIHLDRWTACDPVVVHTYPITTK